MSCAYHFYKRPFNALSNGRIVDSWYDEESSETVLVLNEEGTGTTKHYVIKDGGKLFEVVP